jgi:hypothetical protein
MGDKYKIKKDDISALFATAEMLMENNYHSIYSDKLGWKQGPNGNFYCWNTSGHSKGTDTNPSLSVDNKTGKWHCFTCGIKGNIQSYWKEYLKGSAGGDSYTDWIIDFLGMASSDSLKFSTSTTDPDFEKNSQQIKQLYETLQEERFKKTGKKWILSEELCKVAKETKVIPMDQMDEWVDMLLGDSEALNYLKRTRNINEDVIKKYRIGMNKYGKFMFPVINAEGQLINVKAYDPRCGNPAYKWSYPFKGYENGPVPINNFTQQKIYFFGGEPDCYCAIAMGIAGAVTFGSEAITDVDKVFGQERARQIFLGKEIVICLDSDETGVMSANKLAKSLYPYAKQIKIINLDKSEINPQGLDPALVKEVGEGENKKVKRVEKDFTDFIKKNGFGVESINFFDNLIENTIVYTQNFDRVQKEKFKVTLQESRYPRYFSSDDSKVLEIIASVGELNNKAFMCCKNFSATCSAMNSPEGPNKSCNNCMLPKMPGFTGARQLDFHFVREIPKEHEANPFYIKITEHDSLGLIEVLNSQKDQQQRALCGISKRCEQIVLKDGLPEKLLHVVLKKDINEYIPTENITNTGGSDMDVEAYMVGEKDIYPNKTYKFEATQTTAWNGQHAVLFIHKAEPIETCIDTFKQDQQTYELLQIFKQKPNETISDHLERRYNIFADAAGVTGRKEMFFLNDLAFFSAVTINSELLPRVKRGWVEILIAGDTRTCKSIISGFLHNHYKIGDIITGSTAVSRAGLMGGVTKTNTKHQILWGKIPMNDKGIIIIDELSNIKEDVLFDMTGCRSDGIVSIDTIASGKALARTRKIMLSNQREWKTQIRTSGIQFVKKLCLRDEILARFDLAWVARREDVNVDEFKAIYQQIQTEFTEYQCQNLIRFIYSRKQDDFVFEDGFEELINKYQVELTTKFHPSTQLVNQEMRAKMVRLSVALASMLFSTVEDDWDKILVKKEHLDYIVKFIYFLYCHKNMELDVYSNKIRQNEVLGDMSFMENICEYIDVNQLDQTEEFTDKYVQQIFFDYLYLVQDGKLSIPDAKNDARRTMGLKVYESAPKLIGLLTSRHCFERTTKGTYKKTEAFSTWITKRLEMGDDAPKSNILEFRTNIENFKVAEASKKFVKAS